MAKLGWTVYSTELLRMIPGVDLLILNSNCCGIAGTYGFKKEYYNYSQLIGEPLFKQIEQECPDFVATDCETCKWQIEMSTNAKVEILYRFLPKPLTRKPHSSLTTTSRHRQTPSDSYL